MKKTTSFVIFAALVLTFASLSLPVLGKPIAGNSKTTANKKKVIVAIIKAEWCSACQKVEPIMSQLMQEYGDRISFVVLDVTNDETTEKAAAAARAAGLTNFFEANKKKTSTIGVFKGGKQTFVTVKNYSRDDYVAAFDQALK